MARAGEGRRGALRTPHLQLASPLLDELPEDGDTGIPAEANGHDGDPGGTTGGDIADDSGLHRAHGGGDGFVSESRYRAEGCHDNHGLGNNFVFEHDDIPYLDALLMVYRKKLKK